MFHLTDWHLLHAGCAERMIERHVERIKNDPHAIVVGTGDYLECIGYKDVRFSPREFPTAVRVCDLADYGKFGFDYLYEKLKPIASKIVALGYGNHEKVLMHRTDSGHLWTQFLERLGVANLGYCGFLDLRFKVGKDTHLFRIAAHHGAGAAQSAGGVVNRLKAFMTMFEADIVLTGHLHKRCDMSMSILGADEQLVEPVSSERMGVVGSSYLRTYTSGVHSYGEERGYEPVPLGNPCITIQPETRKLGVDWPR